MKNKSQTLHGRNAGFNGESGKFRSADQPQYNHIAEFIQDCQKFEREVKHFRSVTPEPRTMVYRVAASVPFVSHAALLKRGWI